MVDKGNKYHWIVYHLKAMDYADIKFNMAINLISGKLSNKKMTEGELKAIIKELISYGKWYNNQIEYHREKATHHIPEIEKVKWAKSQREKENKSLESVFLTADKVLSAEGEAVWPLKRNPKGEKTNDSSPK